MNMNNDNISELNRRDFLRGSSMATLMMMMGGVAIGAEETPSPTTSTNAFTNYKGEAAPVKVGVIGCGLWAREILKTLALLPNGPVVALCDPYAPFLRRAGNLAPKAEKYAQYQELLANKEVQAVIVATPSYQHKEIVLAALQAGKHVYCEAPLATTVEDARAIAQAAKNAPKLNFQVGLQNRSDKQAVNLGKFLRTGVLGRQIRVRGQADKKTSWRLTSPNPDREKESNWRLSNATSPGLMGEIGIHQVDLASWYLMANPVSVSGLGSIINWNDGRDVCDSVTALFEYPGGVVLDYATTLANSFEGELNVLYGSDCAIMFRDRRAWMFKEVDAPQLGWEIYAKKDAFYTESGIVLAAGATKQTAQEKGAKTDLVDETSPLNYALHAFLLNSNLVGTGVELYAANYDATDIAGLKEYLATLEPNRLAAAGYKEGYTATLCALKANEAIVTRQKITFQKEWFEV